MKKILVRAPQWLGDAVVSTVFLTRLKHKEPQSELSVLCMPSLVPLFEGHPAVQSVHALPYPKESVFAAAKKIRAEDFDEAYLLSRSFRTALEVFLARIPKRIGYAGDLRGFLLTDSVRYDANMRYAHRYLRLINEETLPLESVSPYFPSIIEGLPSVEKPLFGIAPISIAPSRTWLPERFAEVANAWQKKNGGTVVLFGSAKERPAVQKIADQISGKVFNTAGELTLPQLGGLLKQCRLFLCNDSGLMHVASAFQIPTIVVFGASDPRYALPPWGSFQSIQHKEIFCVPCLRNECVRLGDDHFACLKAVSSIEVLRWTE